MSSSDKSDPKERKNHKKEYLHPSIELIVRPSEESSFFEKVFNEKEQIQVELSELEEMIL